MSLPSYNEALEKALLIVQPIASCQTVMLEQALGRVLATDIVADRDLPPYNRSQMDGYAVVASEVSKGVAMKVTSRIAAGSCKTISTKPNTCGAIATGARIPEQYDAVVQHELTDRGDLESNKVTFHTDDVTVGKAIHTQGADATKGTVLVHSRAVIAAQHIGIAATVGVTELAVVRKPKVVVLTSGDEVISPTQTPQPYQIRNGNGPMITALFETFGCEVLQQIHVKDDLVETEQAVSKALQICDLLVTVGGISVGEKDFFPQAFESAKVEFAVEGVAMQPGKPVIIGKNERAVVLGLPGNPVSALACAHLFGLPLVSTLLGAEATLGWVQLPLATSVVPNKHRTAFRPCNIVDGKINIPSWQGSGDLVHTSPTVGLAQLPMGSVEISSGEFVAVLLFVN